MVRLGEEAVFQAARRIDRPDARRLYLDHACGADAGLRGRVEALLRAFDEGQSFLERPAVPPPAPGPETASLEPGADTPTGAYAGSHPESGAVIAGRFRLLEVIGEGGMGTVWRAEQTEPVRREVALKVIKAGMDSRQVLARFEAERQALALMDHPHIAKVYDAGVTAEGRPYFVMELVRGVPITQFCDDHRLPPQDRLALFVPVCQAIQHAHQKGVIHRDIKPSNVLVALYDGDPVPKVIDFGIAKAAGQPLTAKTLATGLGAVVGTPEYMSPEQADLNNPDIDTRSDIYSLGVLLYELLTGSTPLTRQRVKDAALLEVLRVIREEDPPKPSTRLSDSKARLPSISTQRHMEPAKLTRLVRGELDWIVMKCLEKDRSRRYESANACAADILRYLNDEAVQACPPSAGYRFRKFARRNRRAVATAVVAALAVVLGVAGLATSTVLISRQQRATADALEAETWAKNDLRREAYFHRIALAHRELATDNLGSALMLLDECPEDLRGWEWNYLTRLGRFEPLVIRDEAEVNSIAFSPDGARLATALGNGSLRVRDSRTGRVIRTLENAHAGFASTVAFHPGGRHLASLGADKRVRVWDLTTGRAVFDDRCDAVHLFGTAYAVAFSPDGHQLATGSDGTVKVWDWAASRPLRILAGHEPHPVNVAYHSRLNVAFSRDGRRLASGNWQGSVKLWDAEAGGGPLGTFSETPHPISALAFGCDGRLAIASFDRRVDVWDTVSGALLRTLRQSGLVQCVAFSPDDGRLASGGEDKVVHLWDPATGREVLGLRGHTGYCGCVAFSPDGHRLASASNDRTVRVWDATPLMGQDGRDAPAFTGHDNEVWTLAVSPDGRHVVSAGFGTPAKVWDARTRQVTAEFTGHRQVEFCAAWHPDGRRIASAGMDREPLRFAVQVWDARTGQPAFAIAAGQEVFTAAFSPDGRYLVTGGADRAVRVWDARTGAGVGLLGTHGGAVRGVVFSPSGGRLASVSSDGQVRLWDATRLAEAQDPRHTLPVRIHGPCMNIAFSPDGRRLATGGEASTIRIWDAETGRPTQTLEGHRGDVYAVAFSPGEGRWVAAGGEDSTVKVWDTRSGTPARSFRGHTGLVTSVAFSPDGKFLVSASRDRTVKLWDVTQLHEVPDR